MHSDLNNFYASVERILNPDLKGKPIAVCGNEEERRGIVLAKSEEAKRHGVKTGDTVWQARRKCEGLIIVSPHFNQYMHYSRLVKGIYARYTDLIENYGIDECWLDVTHSLKIFPEYDGQIYTDGGKSEDGNGNVGDGKGGNVGDGERHFTDDFLRFIGDTIRFKVKEELGLTVSVGVSFNKVFAKLGSDLKKPDGTSVISAVNYKSVIYGLPVSDLLMVGAATDKKLRGMGYDTIGRLAAADDERVVKALGKFGRTLLTYARGEDDSPVRAMDEDRQLKSIGNSTTCPKDLTDYDSVKRTLFVLSESVATRLREADLGFADTVHLWVRDSELNGYQVQRKVRHTRLCGEIAEHAFTLFKEKFKPPFKVRALGVTVSGFDSGTSQITFDETAGDYGKREKAEMCVDEIRKKYGYASLQRGIIAEDPTEMHNDVKNTHLIKPARFDDLGEDGEQ